MVSRLTGRKTGIADETTQILFRGAIVRARSGHDIFIDHDAAHVICAKPQRHLSKLESLGQHELCTLWMLSIKKRAMAIVFRKSEAVEVRMFCRNCIFRLKGPADKRHESAGPVLQVADLLQVLWRVLPSSPHDRTSFSRLNAVAGGESPRAQRAIAGGALLRGDMILRTRSTRISAPPPGNESSPAAIRRSTTTGNEAVKPWRCSGFREGEKSVNPDWMFFP